MPGSELPLLSLMPPRQKSVYHAASGRVAEVVEAICDGLRRVTFVAVARRRAPKTAYAPFLYVTARGRRRRWRQR